MSKLNGLKAKILFSLAAMAFASVGAFAAELSPSLGGSGPWAGQAELLNYNSARVALIDWVVLQPFDWIGSSYADLVNDVFGVTESDAYLYAYQLESEYADLDTITINAEIVNVIGWVSQPRDLETVGWGGHSLAGEDEFPVQAGLENAISASIDYGSNVTWGFANSPGGIDAGEESTIVWYTSPVAPMYDYVGVNNHSAASFGNGLVPVPTPEPGSMALGVLCLGLMGLNRRR